MLRIRGDILQSVKAASGPEDLYAHLQAAIELEHATIPAYLAALYSLKRGQNLAIAALVRSIVVEEMLHMTIAANVLNALGGAPAINTPDFIPQYPRPLPMNVDDGLQVGLAPLSPSLVHDVFMAIETPETPQHFPVKAQALAAAAGYATIGLFYAALIDKITQLGDGAFGGDPARQVVDNTWFPAGQLFAITDVACAAKGLRLIIDQGEGTKGDSLEPGGSPAHYYRFAEIYYGRRLIPDAAAPEKYSYSGAPIPCDPAGVWDEVINPKLSRYKAGSAAAVYAERFNQIYGNLLNGLHLTFNGAPDHLRQAIGGMYELRLAADALIRMPDEVTGKQAAPTFEYALV